MKIRTAAAAAAAIAIVGVTVFAAAPATAAPISTAAVTAGPDFTPSSPTGKSARKYMLNIVGSMLGKVTPNKWQREQLANQYQFNHSWEQWEAEFGIPGDVPEGQLITDGYLTTPQTKADYELRKSQMGLKGGKAGKPFSAPATKTTKFVNGVGAAGAIITAASVGLQAGKGISEMMGFDVNGGLCMHDGVDFIGFLTGTDCEGFYANQEAYVANEDALLERGWGQMCASGYCVEMLGMAINANGSCAYLSKVGSGANIQFGFMEATFAGSESVEQSQIRGGAAGSSDYSSCPSGSRANVTVPTTSGGLFYHRDADKMRVLIYVNGTPARSGYVNPIEPDPDPDRYLTCTIEGTDGHTYTADSPVYNESEGQTEPVCPVLPDGVAPTNLQIDKSGPKGPTTVVDEPVTEEYLDWWNSYPECRTGSCKLDLIKKPTTPGVSCFDLDAECADWFTAPSKGDLYQCRYGIHDVDLAECNVYEGVFKPERIAVGAPYSDPLTGEWSGGQSAPKPDSDALGQTIQDPTKRRGCDGMNATGFDPVGFVMRPVQCALEWAFVPRPAVVESEVVKMAESWENTPPGQFILIMTDFGIDIESSCTGYPVDLFGNTVYIGAACTGVFKDFADKVKPISTVLAAAGGLFGISSSVGSVIGYRKLGD